MRRLKTMEKIKKQFKCYICNWFHCEDEITYKEDDLKKEQPICHNCLKDLFYGDKQLEDN